MGFENTHGLVYRGRFLVGQIDEGTFSASSTARRFTPADLRALAALIEAEKVESSQEDHPYVQYENPANCQNYMRF